MGASGAAVLASLADRLEREAPPGLVEVVPGYVTLLVYYDPLVLSWPRLDALLDRAVAAAAAGAADRSASGAGPARLVEVPVLYGGEGGPDLEAVAALAGLTPEAVVRLHASEEYTVALLGFAPGFAYMGRLPERLRPPRLPKPRTAVPPGSVAVAGEQTAVYPGGTPGGWRLIGRTPLTVYDPGREPRSLFRPGDRVRFRPIAPDEFARLAPPEARPLDAVGAGADPAGGGRPVFVVRRPGPQTTIQDAGRFGYQREGVPVAGAVDAFSLALANRLAGNAAGAAALEILLMGLELEALDRGVAALAGADLGARLNGRPVAPGESFAFGPGDRLSFAGGGRGCRAYLAVAGGFAVPEVLGSRSTDLLGRLGGLDGRPLRAGDVLRAGAADAPLDPRAGRRLRPGVAPDCPPEITVRALPGPQEEWFGREALERFFGHPYSVTPASDRMGLRLEGPPVPPEAGRELLSEGTPPGSVQVPGEGRPIVLLAGCQTVGGYPKIATVISADLHLLGQARPGYTRVRFQSVTLEEAHAALAAQARLLADPGLFV